ncbi:MAG: glycogen synthase [Solirubrobacterales bacterium]|jgi:glycosyltransferase involved in cell wall biosynthesis|nr:glycogen synthase [Solirubrobacterales bacterium]
MRVLSIGMMYPPHDLGGGYELTWRSAVREWRAGGDVVRVLASDWRRPDAPPELDDDVHRQLRVYWRDHGFPRLGLRARLALERENARVLDRHLDELRPDAVNWWAMGGMSLSLVERVRRAGIPAVGVVGDDWLNWGPRADGWIRPFRDRPGLARAVERVSGLPTTVDLASSATWLFNSETMRASALAIHPDLERAEVANPGIDDSAYSAVEGHAWGWRLLYLGRMDRRKGVHLAIEALSLLPGEATLVLQGGGDADYERELRELAAELGLERRVTWAREPRERLADVYAASDAVLFPVQWEEPWGLVPLEAMAVGRPVIATGTGGSGEYLRDGENCVIFEPRDSPDALAAAVVRLASSEELRERLRAGGTETAARFTEAAYNERIRAALAEAVGGSP